jgi:hypothetical protein
VLSHITKAISEPVSSTPNSNIKQILHKRSAINAFEVTDVSVSEESVSDIDMLPSMRPVPYALLPPIKSVTSLSG